MHFEKFIDFRVFEGSILDINFTRPESQRHIFKTCDEFAEISSQNRLQNLLQHI